MDQDTVTDATDAVCGARILSFVFTPNRSTEVNDKELADKVVALGVGTLSADNKSYWLPCGNLYVTSAYKFVRDWRVAGALMEKALNGERLLNIAHDKTVFIFTGLEPPADYIEVQSESLPRAIIEACVEALSNG
jgi:hypothetical protein